MSGEQLVNLLAKLVDGKNEQDTRLEALLTAIKNPPAPDAATIRADKVLIDRCTAGVNLPPPWGLMFEMFFLKVIGYKIHTYLPPAFRWDVFGPRVEKNMLKH